MAEPIYIHKKEGTWKASALRALLDAAPDGQYAVTFKRHSGRKSTAQNGYLHVLFQIVADTLNSEGMGDGSKWTMEKVKEWCKAQGCYPTETVRLKGVKVEVTKQTRELSKEDAMVTIDRVMNYWAEFGIILPAPNEQLEIIKP
jgi:hypothetical protein